MPVVVVDGVDSDGCVVSVEAEHFEGNQPTSRVSRTSKARQLQAARH
jgi:hypothetical protein